MGVEGGQRCLPNRLANVLQGFDADDLVALIEYVTEVCGIICQVQN